MLDERGDRISHHSVGIKTRCRTSHFSPCSAFRAGTSSSRGVRVLSLAERAAILLYHFLVIKLLEAMGINVSLSRGPHTQILLYVRQCPVHFYESVLFTHSLNLQSCRSVRPAWWLHSKWAVYSLFILIQRMFSVLGKTAVLDLRCFSRLMVNTWVLYRLISYWHCRFSGFHLIYTADTLSSYVTVLLHWMCLWSGDHSAILFGTAGGTGPHATHTLCQKYRSKLYVPLFWTLESNVLPWLFPQSSSQWKIHQLNCGEILHRWQNLHFLMTVHFCMTHV